jgi:hypothetical protein
VNASVTLGRGERIGGPLAEAEQGAARRLRRAGEQRHAVVHQGLVAAAYPVPFEQGEFGMMQRAALAVAEHAGELDDPLLARGQ